MTFYKSNQRSQTLNNFLKTIRIFLPSPMSEHFSRFDRFTNWAHSITGPYTQTSRLVSEPIVSNVTRVSLIYSSLLHLCYANLSASMTCLDVIEEKLDVPRWLSAHLTVKMTNLFFGLIVVRGTTVPKWHYQKTSPNLKATIREPRCAVGHVSFDCSNQAMKQTWQSNNTNYIYSVLVFNRTPHHISADQFEMDFYV